MGVWVVCATVLRLALGLRGSACRMCRIGGWIVSQLSEACIYKP